MTDIIKKNEKKNSREEDQWEGREGRSRCICHGVSWYMATGRIKELVETYEKWLKEDNESLDNEERERKWKIRDQNCCLL